MRAPIGSSRETSKGELLCVYLTVSPSSHPWREEVLNSENGRGLGKAGPQCCSPEGLSLGRFWLGQHLPVITAPPPPTPNHSTSRQTSATGGRPGPRPLNPRAQ